MTIMEKATKLIISIYGDHPTMKAIRTNCGRWKDCHGTGYSISSGMFRQTIIPKNHQFVIKTGMVRSGNSQCKREIEFYHEAEKENLARYFSAPIGSVKIGTVNFYIFEYIGNINGRHPAKLHDDDYMYYEFENWVEEDDVNDLIDFLDDMNINDLHESNYGFMNGHVVLTDYSGYWEEDHYSNRIFGGRVKRLKIIRCDTSKIFFNFIVDYFPYLCYNTIVPERNTKQAEGQLPE